MSVGNLPPHCSVLIKITYVAELETEGEKIVFRVPASVAPWKKDSALDTATQVWLGVRIIKCVYHRGVLNVYI